MWRVSMNLGGWKDKGGGTLELWFFFLIFELILAL